MSPSEDVGGTHRPKINTYNVLVLLAIGMTSINFGYAGNVIGITLGQPSFLEYFDLTTRKNATQLIGATNGIFSAGGVVGTFCLPWIADRWGRRWACAVPALLVITSGAFLCGSVHIGMFIAFRFFAGAGSWMSLAAAALMMNELAPAHIRGACVDVNGSMFLLGCVISTWTGFGFYWWTNGGTNTWRPPFAIQIFWGLCAIAPLPFIPESPRFLCMKGRYAEAQTVLIKLHADPRDNDHVLAMKEIYQIRRQIELDLSYGNTWAYIIKKPSYRKRAVLTLATTLFTQCSGALVINNYGPSVYRALGFNTTKQLLFPSIWLTCGVVLNVLAMVFVDRFPRPKYMAFGLFGCMVTLSVEAALVAQFVPSTNTSALEAAVAMFFVFLGFYETCINGTQWSYIGEIFPSHLRAKGLCLGVANVALVNLIWLQATPTAFATIGWRFYICFIIPGMIGAVIMFFHFPDTNGLPLEEVAAIFGDASEVATYQRELQVDSTTHTIIDNRAGKTMTIETEHVEIDTIAINGSKKQNNQQQGFAGGHPPNY